jgi:hypothetical protein
LEIAASAATGGALAPILGLDGGARIVNGLGKLYTLETQVKSAAVNVPSNLLGDVGAAIDGGFGNKTQFYLQSANDLFTTATGVGIVGNIGELGAALNEGNQVAAWQALGEVADATAGVIENIQKIIK